jgi:CTP:molybdopterin cytidylyltransferase MocA
MTVAAVILAATDEDAVAPTEGQPRVRRLVDIAWAGGALPVIVVSPDPDGAVARALAGSAAVLAQPAGKQGGLLGQIRLGTEAARAEVRDLGAILVWPSSMTWVGPETVTSLIEAHGVDRDLVLQPTWQGQTGWPVLIPLTRLVELEGTTADRPPPLVIGDLIERVPSRALDLGDPGVLHDVGTPRSDLPPYEGPPDPPAGHTHEWGDDVVAEADLPSPTG